ncbi:copper resistance protein CopC [Meiothermus ruber]|nr:copper resistance protein CopC [Meiothermus ruber]
MVIALRPGLGPGVYVVLWRVLSVDSHTTQGFFVFVVEP